MQLNAAYIAIAFRIQEAATKMCHEDIRTRIQNALRDAAKASGEYGCYVAAIFGDDKSGDVVYSCGYGDGLKKAGYTISGANCTINTASAVDVQPLTTYEIETAVTATEAGARNSKRDLNQLQAIHDATATLGAQCTKAAKESNVSRETSHSSATDPLQLVEASSFAADIAIREAIGKQIKLIAPGLGSSAFYPAEVLKRDGPKVFKAGTPMRIDHPTAAEEAARPEGSVKDWGAVLATDAVWIDEHKEGPGLYGSIKTFSDHEATISEKGPYAGVSIRATGSALMENGKPVMKSGRPVLASLHSAEGVDMVTRAGAGGMFLSESARRTSTTQKDGENVDTEEIKRLIAEGVTSGIAKATQPLIERALRGDATVLATSTLSGLKMTEAQKGFVISNSLKAALPVTAAGALDEAAFKLTVISEAKAYAATLGDGAKVLGMGALEVKEAGVVCSECGGNDPECVPCQGTGRLVESAKTRRVTEAASEKEALESSIAVFESIGLTKEQATFAAKGRAA